MGDYRYGVDENLINRLSIDARVIDFKKDLQLAQDIRDAKEFGPCHIFESIIDSFRDPIDGFEYCLYVAAGIARLSR